MKIYSAIVGNLHAPEWAERAAKADIETVELDQWTAQKSRLVATSDRGNEYAVALARHTQLLDGDILEYDPDAGRMVALRIRLNDVLVADLGELADEQPEEIIHIALELGHAIGNQHWPAVVKGTKVYVPLTVDKKVMESVMHTHRIEHVRCSFQPGSEIIPYLAPHEIRRLFGGAGHENETPHHHRHHHHHAHA
ncbi:MAG: urease accessory protein UreE [Alistipes sp.]|nr:urease accessory protein UreE [Alistipes sp.]MDE6508485.1 urease accessory protein UreE [Alistipes sp.]MDE7344225.1 urease accessory protein UreE [Alistipes sp.]